MNKHLKNVLLLTLGIFSLSTLALTVTSYFHIIARDLSKDGTNWACVHVRDGTFLVTYVDADEAPRLTAISPPKIYRDHRRAYRWMVSIQSMRDEKIQDAAGAPSLGCGNAVQLNDEIQAAREYMTFVKKVAPMRKSSQRLLMIDLANGICKEKSWAGFFVDVDSPPREIVLRLPLAAFALLFGLAPMIALCHRLRIRSRRMKQNLCLTCGYNLTGNLSGTCPECGKAIT
jgi:hypothetical protein